MQLTEGLPYLTDLSLAENQLSGSFSQIFAEGRNWQRFDVRFNAFDYERNDDAIRDTVPCPDLMFAPLRQSLPSRTHLGR